MESNTHDYVNAGVLLNEILLQHYSSGEQKFFMVWDAPVQKLSVIVSSENGSRLFERIIDENARVRICGGQISNDIWNNIFENIEAEHSQSILGTQPEDVHAVFINNFAVKLYPEDENICALYGRIRDLIVAFQDEAKNKMFAEDATAIALAMKKSIVESSPTSSQFSHSNQSAQSSQNLPPHPNVFIIGDDEEDLFATDDEDVTEEDLERVGESNEENVLEEDVEHFSF